MDQCILEYCSQLALTYSYLPLICQSQTRWSNKGFQVILRRHLKSIVKIKAMRSTNLEVWYPLPKIPAVAQLSCSSLIRNYLSYNISNFLYRQLSLSLSLSPNDGSDWMSFNLTFEASQTFNFPTAVIQLSDVRLFVGCAPTRKSSEELERALSCFGNQISSSGSKKSLLKPTV